MFNWARNLNLSSPGRRTAGYALVLLILVWLYGWRLGSMTTGWSPAEVSTVMDAGSWSAISDQPVNTPYKLVLLGLSKLGADGLLSTRLATAVFSLVLIIAFWNIAREWFGRLIGSLGCLLLASTTWLLVSGRLVEPAVMLLWPAGLLASYLWLSRARWPWLAWLVFCLVAGSGLFIPGGIWLLLILGFFARKRLLNQTAKLSPAVSILGLALILGQLAWLVWLLIGDWALLKPLLFIPDHLAGFGENLKNFGWSTLSLFWQTPQNIGINIGRWPLLTVVQALLGLVGGLVMWSRARGVVCGLVAMVLLAVAASALNQNYSYLLLAAAPLALMQTAGLRYLYLEWRTIFPRNPIPQVFALAILIALVGIHVVLAANYALAAWPETVAVKTSYVIK